MVFSWRRHRSNVYAPPNVVDLVTSCVRWGDCYASSLFFPAKVQAHAGLYKIGSLATLTFQNVVTILLIRYTKTLPGEVFISSTVVVLMEVFKLFASLFMLLLHHRSLSLWWKDIHEEIIRKPVETLKTAVPAFIYTFQNNLTFVAISNLDAATFQVERNYYIISTLLQPSSSL